MTAPVTFQRATNAHLAVVQRLVDDALREYGLRVLLDSSDIDLTDIEQHYDARGGALELLLEAGEQLIGVMGWRPGLDGAGKPVPPARSPPCPSSAIWPTVSPSTRSSRPDVARRTWCQTSGLPRAFARRTL
jgi:hypothetical protein